MTVEIIDQSPRKYGTGPAYLIKVDQILTKKVDSRYTCPNHKTIITDMQLNKDLTQAATYFVLTSFDFFKMNFACNRIIII